MIGVTKLLCGTATVGDVLRYGRDSSKSPHQYLQFTKDKRPVVVWNYTRRCNLRCVHCYAESENHEYENELTTEEGKRFIDDLSEFKAPVLLFSGGEPFIRKDLFELGAYAKEKGLRPVISTNGTLITEEIAAKVKEVGFGYVGVSLDGIGEKNDSFRGVSGAYEKALRGIRNCVKVGQNVGLRFTITRYNAQEVPKILDLVESENINRLCFYHLVYTGRGSSLQAHDVSRPESRALMDLIMDKTLEWQRRGIKKDVLTVDNHCDGPYLYMRVLKTQPERAEEVLQLLKYNGGNSAGIGIADVDNEGNVHADQFWGHHTFGNVRDRKFGEIWTDLSDPLMAGLKNRKPLLKGRCAQCKWLDICNGNFRVRAEAVTGDTWASDPACYLTDEEIGIK